MIQLTIRSGTDYRLALRLGSALAEYNAEVSVARVGRIVVSVAPSQLLPTAIQLRDKWAFDEVLSVTGIDYPERAVLALVYHLAARLRKTLRHLVVSLQTEVPRREPKIHTLAFVWPSADLHERETHELLGIEFANHPNLGPLLLPEDWEGGWPLRKDFVLRTAEEVER